ncbi:MAG TPA: hypothetical protein V6D17_15435, partial [Candidatus Obscuribacterales bacterium]
MNDVQRRVRNYARALLLAVTTTSLLALPLLFYYLPFWSGKVCYASSDHHLYFEPFAKLIGETMRKGRLLLWNPYVHLGMPQVGLTAISLFYPPNILFALLPYSAAMAGLMAFHQFVAGLGMARLSASLGARWPAAIVAGVVAGYCGYMFALSANYSLVASIAWLPLAVWSYWRLSRAETTAARSAWCVVSSLLTALTITAGRPELFVPALLILAFVCLMLLFSLRGKGLADAERAFAWFSSIAAIAGLLLAMPMLLPAFEWQSVSPRAEGLPAAHVFIWSANWYNFLTMV